MTYPHSIVNPISLVYIVYIDRLFLRHSNYANRTSFFKAAYDINLNIKNCPHT